MKNYILTNDTIKIEEHRLYRIKCIKAFKNVKEGEIGGFIESYDNLDENAWVYDNAKVYGYAKVYGNAKICGNSVICGYSKVYDNAYVTDNAMMFGNPNVHGNTVIYDNATVCGYAEVYGNAHVYGKANVYANAKVYEHANVYGNAVVQGQAVICGNASVNGNAYICGNAIINSKEDYIVFKNWWSSGRYFTWTKSNDMLYVGCFYGTGEKLINKAYKDSEKSGREYEKAVRYIERIKSQDNE